MDWLGSVYDDKPRDLHRQQDDERNGTSYPDGTDSYSETLSPGPYINGDVDEDEDEDRSYAQSLTKRLAETAVGVREVSKKLGQ